MERMKKIIIKTEYIKLDQFLKLSGISGSGGEARAYIEDNVILVNGEREERRGRKLRNRDEISIGNEIYVIEQAGVDACM